MSDKPITVITAQNLQVHYGKLAALNIEELEISGNLIALVGHNGSGKSTFLKTLLGLTSPTNGKLQASMNGKAMVAENDMAFSPETGAIFSDIAVEDYLKLWCRLKRKDSDFYKTKGKQIIETLSIAELQGKLGRELSKGQKRRVQIAACLLIEPRLQVFDEPFDGLDIQQASSLAETVNSHLHETSILISSHRMDVVERLADSIIMLEKGEVIASGPTASIYSKLRCKGFGLLQTSVDGFSNRELVLHLSQRFPKGVIHTVGAQVNLTAIDLSREKIESSLQSLNLKNYRIEEYTPSFSDAVHVRQKML